MSIVGEAEVSHKGQGPRGISQVCEKLNISPPLSLAGRDAIRLDPAWCGKGQQGGLLPNRVLFVNRMRGAGTDMVAKGVNLKRLQAHAAMGVVAMLGICAEEKDSHHRSPSTHAMRQAADDRRGQPSKQQAKNYPPLYLR